MRGSCPASGCSQFIEVIFLLSNLLLAVLCLSMHAPELSLYVVLCGEIASGTSCM